MKSKLARAIPKLGEFIPTMQPSYATVEDTLKAHNNTTWASIKHDGYRVQVHRGKSLIKIFTRNGNELNYDCYPDILAIAKGLPACILDAELVAKGSSHKEIFDNVKKRFRRPGIKQESVNDYLKSGIVGQVPLDLRVFDALRFERKGLLHLPLSERAGYMENIDEPGIVPVENHIIDGAGVLENFIDSAFRDSQEGVVCKDPRSQYRPGSKTTDWVKFKRSETLDLVVVGFYKNTTENLPFSSVLVAAYNESTGRYETLGRIGTTREGFAKEIDEATSQYRTADPSDKVAWSEKLSRPANDNNLPDMYIDPENSVVLEIRAMNLNYNANWQSCGEKDGKAFSMRIGWVYQLRPDKSPGQATTTATIRKLYKLQEVAA